MSMNPQQLKNIIEAALLAANQPLSIDRIGNLFSGVEQPTRDAIRAALDGLAQDCSERGVELKEVSSGYRLQVKSDFAPWVSRLWEERPPRYSRALLETLVLIAYRQPITRAEIEDVRGVTVSTNIIRTLQEREWIRVLGHREVPGRPALYGTSRQFLDYFSLTSLEDLPPLSELRDLDDINMSLDLGDGVDGQPQRGLFGSERPESKPEGERPDESEEESNRLSETAGPADEAVVVNKEAASSELDETQASVAEPTSDIGDGHADGERPGETDKEVNRLSEGIAPVDEAVLMDKDAASACSSELHETQANQHELKSETGIADADRKRLDASEGGTTRLPEDAESAEEAIVVKTEMTVTPSLEGKEKQASQDEMEVETADNKTVSDADIPLHQPLSANG